MSSDEVSSLVGLDGTVNNPYARLGEWADEKLHGATSKAHDGQTHSIEVVAWANLIDNVLKQVKETLHTGDQVREEDGSVNFIIMNMETGYFSKVSIKVNSDLPAGCTVHYRDPHAKAARAERSNRASSPASRPVSGVARPPRGRAVFINVTERAQSNLEWRRKFNKKVRKYYKGTFCVCLILFIVFSTLVYKHTEGYRDPFETLAETASNMLSTK